MPNEEVTEAEQQILAAVRLAKSLAQNNAEDVEGHSFESPDSIERHMEGLNAICCT